MCGTVTIYCVSGSDFEKVSIRLRYCSVYISGSVCISVCISGPVSISISVSVSVSGSNSGNGHRPNKYGSLSNYFFLYKIKQPQKIPANYRHTRQTKYRQTTEKIQGEETPNGDNIIRHYLGREGQLGLRQVTLGHT